jgi:RHS repeat-associated protein
VGSTAYAYDLADRLNSITQPDTSTVGFTFDAPGRHATTTTLDTYSYIGSGDTVSVDVSTAGAGNTLEAGIDAMGDRLATAASTGFAWIVPDLHGNVAAQCSSSGSVSDVFRYDAYGKLIGTSLTAGSVPSPWRFQGRILESTAGSDTYDFGARAYVPDLGTFTSLDSVAGSAQNPITLNRYLYANANPATLVDPDGHCVEDACIIEGGTALYLLAMATVAVYSAAVAQTNPEVRAAEGDAVANAQQNISNFFSTTWTVPYPNIPLADRGKPGPPPWTLPKPTIAPRTIPQGQGPPDPVPGGPETQPAPPSGQNPFTGLPLYVGHADHAVCDPGLATLWTRHLRSPRGLAVAVALSEVQARTHAIAAAP